MTTTNISLLALLAVVTLAGQTPSPGTVDRIKVHANSLEGNLEDDSPDRSVSVYLPPSYKSAPRRRYPVVYFLHGFTDSEEKWFHSKTHWINLPSVLNKSLAAGAKEMIVVMPDAFTRFQGSMYSSSATTGDWETFIADELPAYIDSHYRTLKSPDSRGLTGHSMGGYGAIRIAMKRPGVFSSVYLLSPCCMAPPGPQQTWNSAAIDAVRTPDDVAKADFGTKAMFASAAAWSPNPGNPPFFLDLPMKDGAPHTAVIAKWAANAPLSMLDQYIATLRRYRAIAFDAGDQDRGIAATVRQLDERLKAYGLAHTFEIYEGNHVNHVAGRIEKNVMPFFSNNLKF